MSIARSSPSRNGHAAAVTLRPATTDDLPACTTIWRDSINDYTRRLSQPDIPEDLGSILRLYAHLHEADPDGFVVAETVDPAGAPRIVGFVSAIRRPPIWFLSMLFVLPEAQAGGVGRTLLREVMPEARTMSLATCTDTAQPISNGLYASLGIVPRLPLFRLVGLPDRLEALAPLPNGVRAVRFDDLALRQGAAGGADLDEELAAIDVEVAGFEHRQDHGFVRTEGRIGLLFVDGAGDPVGYGYASEAGRVGPVAVRDAALLAPAVAHLVTTIEPRGAFGIWLPGEAGEATVTLLRAGFRIEGFPCLICWDRPFADFGRYVPISPGLL
jgi:GNAT superfamily N-acetyltransferase